jgi:hypothetical protein
MSQWRDENAMCEMKIYLFNEINSNDEKYWHGSMKEEMKNDVLKLVMWPVCIDILSLESYLYSTLKPISLWNTWEALITTEKRTPLVR